VFYITLPTLMMHGQTQIKSFPSIDELLVYCVTQCNGCAMKNATYSARNVEVV